MKSRNLAFAAAVVLASGCAISGAANTATEAKTTQSPVDGHTWYPMPFGPSVTPVFGDNSTGQHVTLVKFEPGMTSEVHTHSHDYVGVVVSGNGQHYEVARPETQVDLPSGSHWFVPANVPHISTCVGPDACIFALFQNESFDFLPTSK